MKFPKTIGAFAVVGILFVSAFAQDFHLQRVKDDFVSPWVVSIESGTLVLSISGVTKKSDNVFGLDASFGFVGTPLKPIDAEVQYGTDMRRLKFTTASGIRYDVSLKQDGTHTGSYVGPRGTGNVLSIEKVSESDLQNAIALGTKKPDLTVPDQTVPSECSVFSGSWKGNWNGDANLWITSVDKECQATYVYVRTGWRTKGSAKIQNQKLTFQAASATFEFSADGQQLKGVYKPNDTANRTLVADFSRD